MKRLVLFLLLVCVMISVVGCGSNSSNNITTSKITLHSGVMFGDTIEAIKAKESGEPSEEREYLSLNDILTQYNTESYKRGFGSGRFINYSLRYKNMNVAGFDDCDIEYCTDIDGHLTDMVYIISEESWISDEKIEAFDPLYQNLKEKYGQPTSHDDDQFMMITGKSMEGHACAYITNNYLGSICSLRQYEEWLVPYSNDYMKIELCEEYLAPYPTDRSMFFKTVYLSYSYVSADEVNEARNKVQEEKVAVYDDL